MRSLLTLWIVLAIGVLVAWMIGAALPSFLTGAAYMIAASILLNTMARRRA